MLSDARLVLDSQDKLDKISFILEEKAKQPKDLTKLQFVQKLYSKIDKLLSIVYTVKEVVSTLSSQGVDIQLNTFKVYLCKARQAYNFVTVRVRNVGLNPVD